MTARTIFKLIAGIVAAFVLLTILMTLVAFSPGQGHSTGVHAVPVVSSAASHAPAAP